MEGSSASTLIYCCPKCSGDLVRVEDALECTRCGERFPIIRGIPRFVDTLAADVAQVQRAFDFEHRRFDRSVLTQFSPKLVAQFLADSRIQPEFFRGKQVLDAGCGSGRWSYALANLGAELTSVDLTEGGVESTYSGIGAEPNVRVAQADIFALPFRPESFDFVMSWGVLHHTPSTRAAFDKLVPIVKPGGTLYVMVYESYPQRMVVGTGILRFLLRRMSEERRYRFCRHLVLDTRKHPRLVNTLSKYFMLAAYDPLTSPLDPESYQFGLFDAYSPRWNFTHTRDEVAGWFREIGFEHITVVDAPHGAVKVRGTKPIGQRALWAKRSAKVDPASSTPDEKDHGWLSDFERSHGRPLRVLHLGNIANNAYLNAKIQRRAGIDADVVSFDYYHIMGTPEWEDADFEGDVDEFFPDWWSVDLNGFERPRWFVQGPTRACIDYLLSLRGGTGDPPEAWKRLQHETWLVSRRSPAATAARGARLAHKGLRDPRRAAARLRREIGASRSGASIQSRVGPSFYLLRLATRKLIGILRALLSVAKGTPPKRALAQHVFPTRLAHLLPERVAEQRPDEDPSRARSAADALDPPAAATELGAPALALPLESEDLPARGGRDEVCELFSARFPKRTDQLTVADYDGWRQVAKMWKPVFDLYDVVQAYATYPIIPFLAGTAAFTAYEHGTLRDIPFEDSAVGRVTALGYREAPAVFVTNADDLDAARRLAVPDERIIALPHAVDTNKLFDFAATHTHISIAPESELTLFAPARHDWTDGFTSQLKGNDRIVRAVGLCRERGTRLTVIFVDWGRHVDDTKRLIADLGLDDSFAWIAPLRKKALWRRYLASHAVVDQFVMDAIGGVAFEAMALGRRVITALNHDVNEQFFGQAPPLLAARSPEEIAQAFDAIHDDPGDLAGAGNKAREWVARFHSSDRIVELQASQYATIVGRRTANA